MTQRLKVIQTAIQLFADHQHFNQIDLNGRRKIAGLMTEDGVDYRFFGSMKAVGKFQRMIIDNDENLSMALDLIPSAGGVSRQSYLGYIERYKRAFPKGRHGLPTATRLLAMKRPDTFVCLNGPNNTRLCAAFGVGPGIPSTAYEQYWDTIIERVMDSVWWNAPPPSLGVERSVWEARAAFLDSIYYDRRDLAAS